MNKEQAAQRMGQRITALRKLEGISQQELADRAGLTRQHIGRIEKGELVSVAYVTIQAIAEALQMTHDESGARVTKTNKEIRIRNYD